MRYLAPAVIVFFLAWGVCAVAAADKAKEEKKPADEAVSLASVKWNGPAPTLKALRGKTVVLLIYATWCPKCNAWSGELIKQLMDTTHGKPVVVLAVNADKSPPGAALEGYLSERHFLAPNVVHGYDAGIAKRLNFDSELWKYVWISPKGKVVHRDDAGRYYEDPKAANAPKKFCLPADLAKCPDLGKLNVVRAETSSAVLGLLWPLEMGIVSEQALTKARSGLNADQKEELKSGIDRFLDGRLEEIRGLYKGTVPQRFEAYDKATLLAGMFKATPQSKKAKRVVTFLQKDEQFKKELDAKKAYDKVMQRAALGSSAGRDANLRSVAKRFEGTQYGDMAAAATSKAQ
jgi:thiol-disulfide isomerase/thioredoxin